MKNTSSTAIELTWLPWAKANLCDDEGIEVPSQITAGIYQSGFCEALPDFVDAVLCLSLRNEMLDAQKIGRYPNPFTAKLLDYAWRPIDDNPGNVPSILWLHETAGLIESWRKQGRTVLVHCTLGVSRSTLVVAAYLMRRYEWDFNEAIAFVRVGRSFVNPHFGFLDLLSEYGKKLESGSTFPPPVAVTKFRQPLLGSTAA